MRSWRAAALTSGGWPRGVRKISEGEVTAELFAFLTTDAHPVVAPFHSKATPVILREPAEWEEWLGDGSWEAVAHLQAGLPTEALQVVARDVRKDDVVVA